MSRHADTGNSCLNLILKHISSLSIFNLGVKTSQGLHSHIHTTRLKMPWTNRMTHSCLAPDTPSLRVLYCRSCAWQPTLSAGPSDKLNLPSEPTTASISSSRFPETPSLFVVHHHPRGHKIVQVLKNMFISMTLSNSGYQA